MSANRINIASSKPDSAGIGLFLIFRNPNVTIKRGIKILLKGNAVSESSFSVAVYFLIIFGVFSSAFADWPVEHILLSNDPEDQDKFGQSVCIDGNVCIVGAYGVGAGKGVAEIYRFNGNDWVGEQRISASDGAAWDRFGYSVSIDGNVCAIGAYGPGAAYIFRYNGSSWVEEQKLIPSDEARIFGYAIAVEGDVCLVGSPTALVGGVTKGAVYVFRYNGSSWVQEQKLSASDGEYTDQFGEAVSISGNLCLIGMPNDDVNGTNTGSAYIFEYNGSSWVEQQKLSPTGTRDNWERFGRSVSIDSNSRICVIGASGDSEAADDAGATYVYDDYFEIGSWNFRTKLTAPDAAEDDAFGRSVSINGDMCVVGSYLDDDLGAASGSAYVYKFEPYITPIPIWVYVDKLTASDGEYRDYFGESVAIDGNNVLVGAPADYKDPAIGSVYIYDLTCPSADLTGDCYVDFKDFATMAEQWLDGIKPLDVIP